MAKKKKFNRRILVVLPIVVLIIAAVGVTVVMARLPGDPAVTFAKAQTAFDKGDYYEARRLANQAVTDAAKAHPGSAQNVEYTYKAALLNLRVANEGKPPITMHERTEAHQEAYEKFKKTVLLDPKHADAQKQICDMTRDPVEFITESQKYIKLRPDDDEMIFRHAQANVSMYIRMAGGDWDKAAMADFDRLLAMKPGKLEYWRAKAGLLWEKKDHDGALKLMKDAVAKNPDSADFCVAYADFLRSDEIQKEWKPKKDEKTKTVEKAPSELQYEEAISSQPDNVVGYLALARVRVGDQQYGKAIDLLKTAAQKDPCDFRPYYQAAEAYERSASQASAASEQNADRHKAVEVLELGLSKISDQLSKWGGSPQSAPAAATAPSVTAKASTDKNRMEAGQFNLTSKLASALLRLAGSPEESANRQALLKEASTLGENLNKYKTNCPEYNKVMGSVALAENDLPKAAGFLEEAMSRFEQSKAFDTQAAGMLFNAYWAQGRRGDAQKILENIRKWDKKDVWPLMELIGVSINNGDFARAKEFVATVLAVEPKNEQAISISDALEIADEPVVRAKLPPEMKFSQSVMQVLFQKASTFESEQQHPDAVKLLTQMWEREPRNTAVFMELLKSLVSNHEMSQAKDAIKDARKCFADVPEMMDYLQKNEEVLFASSDSERYRLRLATVDKEKDPFGKAIGKYMVEQEYSSVLPDGSEKDAHAQASLKCLRDALTLKPQSQGVLNALLQRYMLAKQWDDAQAIVDKLAGLNADGVGGKFMKGQFLVNKGAVAGTAGKADMEAAVELVKEGLKEKATNPDSWTLLGAAYSNLAQFNDAEDAYDHALKIDPGHVNSTIAMAKTKLALGKIDEYQALVKRAYRLAPGDPWVKNKYLDIMAPTATADQLARLIKQCETNYQNNPNDPENDVRLARLYEKAKQVSNAEKLYVEVFNRSSNKFGAAELLAHFYMRNKRQAEAETLCTHDLLKDPNVDQAHAYALWGQVLASTPNGSIDAEHAFLKAIELKPDDPGVQGALASFYAQQPNHMKQAADVLAKYVAAQKNPPAEIKKRLVGYLLEAGQYDQAGQMISQMLAADPANYEARELDGLMLLRQNKPAEAIEQFNQALSVNPSHAESFRLRGIAQLQKGDKHAALEDLGRAADISKDPTVEWLLVNVSLSVKDYDNAEKVLSGMKDRRPDDMEVVQKLAAIYFSQKDQGFGRLEKLIADGKTSTNHKEPTYYEIEAQMWAIRNQPAKQLEALKALLAMPEPAIVAAALQSSLQVLQTTGQYDKMSDLIDQHVHKEGLGWVKAYQGYVALKRKKTSEAEKCFAQAVLNASHSQIVTVLIEIEQAYGKPQEAAEKSSQWINQRNGDDRLDPMAWDQIAMEYARAKNIPLVQKAYEIALNNSSGAEKAKTCEGAGMVYYDLAGSQTGQERANLLALSEKAYIEALTLEPDDTNTLNNLAYMYVEDLNQPDKALPYAQRVYILSPAVTGMADTYAWTLAKLKRYDEARNILEQIVETQEGLPPFRYHLGWIYEQTGQYDKARHQYESGLRDTANNKDPLYDVLKAALERIKNK